MTPQPVTDLDMAFGGSVSKLMPAYKDIPEEFRRYPGTKWNSVFSAWFFSGLPDKTAFHAKDGIDSKMALRHIRTIMGSFEPQHEHKEAAVAYLLSLWFDDVVIPDKEVEAL